MDNHVLRQFKHVIVHNKRVDVAVKLTLADKIHMKKLSKMMRKTNNINEITFEDFVLLCKFQKIKATIRIEDNYATRFINVLQFDSYSLNDVLYNCVDDICKHNDENKYKLINVKLLKEHLINHNSSVILYDKFEFICKALGIKITIISVGPDREQTIMVD